MRLILAMLALAAAPHAHAQQTPPTWAVIIDNPGRGEIRDLAIAGNGDIVVGGFIDRDKESVQAGEVDGLLARYAPDGRLIWERRIGGDFRDEVDGLAIAPDGSIYVSGPRDIQLRQKIQDTASYVSRYAADGALIWSTPIDDADGRQVWLTSLRLLDDGSALVAGSATFKHGVSDAYIAKFSSDGERLWQQTPPKYAANVDPRAAGKTMTIRSAATGEMQVQEHGRLSRITRDHVELIATQPDFGGPLPARCLAVNLSNGQFAGKSCGAMDAFGMHMTSASFPFTASRNGDIGTGDGVVRKHDEAGRVLWEFAPTSYDGDGFNAAAPTSDGGVVAAGNRLNGNKVGRHNWDAVLVRLDRDGKQVWRREFDSANRDEFTKVAVMADGSIIVAGYTTPEGASIWKPWIMRLNSEGKLE